MSLYLLKIPNFTQYKYAWAELPSNANFSDDFPRCPICGRAIGQCFWLPPHEIIIKQPRTIGDFVGGIIATHLIVSERFKSKYEESNLTGIEKFNELTVIQMGNGKGKEYSVPKLFGATILIADKQVDYEKMNVKWFSQPKKAICILCCPGGGGIGGIYESYSKIAIKADSKPNSDFFIPINFAGNIILSAKGKTFIEENKFTNVIIISADVAKYDMFQGDQ